ncbi:MAG: class I SAM-dependent methyltransferase [Flavobacteriaceae bacterium]|jgi:SAM-dependent methyltransferase|nr:class I SAM-dependent methyltransferase [Flavobacteriaceae bacterium]
MIENEYKSHWEKVYHKTTFDQLGWYEKEAVPSLNLVQESGVAQQAKILNVGAGATTLVDDLLKLGYTNIIANDLSKAALDVLKNRLSTTDLEKVIFVEDDLTNPKTLTQLTAVDVWHDRAVFHFFTDEKDQNTYFKLLKTVLKPGGFVIIAVFNLEGATKCSGLNVFRYNAEMLQDRLGADFKLLNSFNYAYMMPSGSERSYVYTLFQNIRNV